MHLQSRFFPWLIYLFAVVGTYEVFITGISPPTHDSIRKRASTYQACFYQEKIVEKKHTGREAATTPLYLSEPEARPHAG